MKLWAEFRKMNNNNGNQSNVDKIFIIDNSSNKSAKTRRTLHVCDCVGLSPLTIFEQILRRKKVETAQKMLKHSRNSRLSQIFRAEQLFGKNEIQNLYIYCLRLIRFLTIPLITLYMISILIGQN